MVEAATAVAMAAVTEVVATVAAAMEEEVTAVVVTEGAKATEVTEDVTVVVAMVEATVAAVRAVGRVAVGRAVAVRVSVAKLAVARAVVRVAVAEGDGDAQIDVCGVCGAHVGTKAHSRRAAGTTPTLAVPRTRWVYGRWGWWASIRRRRWAAEVKRGWGSVCSERDGVWVCGSVVLGVGVWGWFGVDVSTPLVKDGIG